MRDVDDTEIAHQELSNVGGCLNEYIFDFSRHYRVLTFYLGRVLLGDGAWSEHCFEVRVIFDGELIHSKLLHSEADALEAHCDCVKQELTNPRSDLSFNKRSI